MKSHHAIMPADERHTIAWYKSREEVIKKNKKLLLEKGDNRAERTAAAFEIRDCCQQLAAYDRAQRREFQHAKDQLEVELYLMKRFHCTTIAELDAKQIQYYLQKKVGNFHKTIDPGSLSNLERMPTDVLFEIAKHLTVEEVGQLASVSINLRRLMSATSESAQRYWQRMVAREFPQTLQMALLESKKRKTKVGNWYRIFVEAYNHDQISKKWPLRFRKIITYIRDGNLEDLKKSGITFADCLFPDPLNSVICKAVRKWENKEVMNYLFDQVFLPAFALGQDNNRIAEEAVVGNIKLVGITRITYWAALCDKLDVVMGLSATEEQKNDALCAAVICKRPAIVRLLLENGAEPSIGHVTDERLVYPELITAVINRDLESLNLLLSHGADSAMFLNIEENCKVKYFWEGRNYVHGATALFMAARYGYEEIVMALLAHGDAEVNVPTEHDEMPLQAAAANGNLVIVQSLVARGATINAMYEIQSYEQQEFDEIRGRGLMCNTALCNAVLNGHADVVKFLIEQGADVNLANRRNPSPLVAAIRQGDLTILQALLAAPDIVVKQHHVDLANSCNQPEIVKAIKIHRLEKYIAKKEYEATHSNRAVKINIFFETKPMNLHRAKELLIELKAEVPAAVQRKNSTGL
jgi:ankyrin repeat protein